MAEQAVLARRRPDRRYDLARSRWGGTNEALAAFFDGTAPTELPDIEWRPWRSGVTLPTLVAELDYLATNFCYRVTTETTVFLVCWFGLPLADETATRTTGALVAVESLADAQVLRTQFRALKGALADALVAGTLPATIAPFVLASWVAGQHSRETYLSPLFESLTER